MKLHDYLYLSGFAELTSFSRNEDDLRHILSLRYAPQTSLAEQQQKKHWVQLYLTVYQIQLIHELEECINNYPDKRLSVAFKAIYSNCSNIVVGGKKGKPTYTAVIHGELMTIESLFIDYDFRLDPKEMAMALQESDSTTNT